MTAPARRIILVLPGERIVCPVCANPFPASANPLPATTRQCRHRDPRMGAHARASAYCGAWVWQWAHGDGSHTVVAIDDTDRRVIEGGHLTVERVRDYLGLTGPTRGAA